MPTKITQTDEMSGCEWTYEDKIECWRRECDGGEHTAYVDYGPDADGWEYCPYCGKKIKEVKDGKLIKDPAKFPADLRVRDEI